MRTKPQKTWIVVADGARAHVVRNDGPGTGLTAVPKGEMATENPPTRETGSDRPGRSYESVGGARHALAPRVDWHQHQKDVFARNVAKMLDEAASAGNFERLILVAPPHTLGELRQALKPQTRQRVIAEINKDLTSLPIPELADHLQSTIKL